MLVDVYNVAFRRDVKIIIEKDFNKTIDVEFGVYKDGKMFINLMPSDGDVDWAINFDFFMKKVRPIYASLTSKVQIHEGFYLEWMKNRDEFMNIIRSTPELLSAIRKGLYSVGRSKGGSEALIIGLDLVRNFDIDKDSVFIGALDAAKTGNDYFCASVEEYINPSHIYWVRYSSDIITQIPPFSGYNNPGVKIRFMPGNILGFVDHALGCFCEERLKLFAAKYDEISKDERVKPIWIKKINKEVL